MKKKPTKTASARLMREIITESNRPWIDDDARERLADCLADLVPEIAGAAMRQDFIRLYYCKAELMRSLMGTFGSSSPASIS